MKKFYIYGIIAIILLPLGVRGTHIYGAQITATAESCRSNTYTITVTGYGDPGSDVGFAVGYLDLGFGDPLDLGTETDFSRQIINVGESAVRVNKFTLDNITFPGPGEYVITFRTFNRNGDVINMRNSVNTPLYVESKLFVDPLLCNSTPQLSDSTSFTAFTGSIFQQSYRAIDPDGDSLSVELVAPQQAEDVLVDSYVLPLDIDLRYADNPTNAEGNGLPTLMANPNALVWNAPNLPGDFAVALRINEWRKLGGEWVQLGYVTRDLTVQVLDTVNNIAFTDIITATENEPDKPKVRLYPNPNLGDFTLEITDDTWLGATASIHNIIGSEVDQRTVTLGENSYSIPDCQPGIYFLTLRQGELQKVLRFMKR